jgi:hypothetical protein
MSGGHLCLHRAAPRAGKTELGPGALDARNLFGGWCPRSVTTIVMLAPGGVAAAAAAELGVFNAVPVADNAEPAAPRAASAPAGAWSPRRAG